MNDQLNASEPAALQPQTDNEKLFLLLQNAVTVYDHGLEIRSKELDLTFNQTEQLQQTERLKVEREYEFRRQTIETRRHEIDRHYDLERERFNRGFWLIVGISIFLAVTLVILLVLAPDHEQRITIVKYFAFGLSLVLGGRGLATLFPGKPQPPKPPQN